jgi:hypothetical protein
VNTAQEEEEEEEEEDEEMEMEGGDVFLDSQDPCESLLPAIEELYLVRDTFFPLDPTIKKARLDNLMREALVVLAEIAAECRKQPEQRTQWEYLRGKVLDAGPDYCKEAEDHLAKSVLTFGLFPSDLFCREELRSFTHAWVERLLL